MSRSINSTFLHVARSLLCVHLTGQIRTCVKTLRPEHIWWRPNDGSNAIGNLVLHCAGSTRFYIGYVVGQSNFDRDRDAEFAQHHTTPAEELLDHLNIAIEEADTVLSNLHPDRLLDPAERTSEASTLMESISLQLTHYATHTGQILYATKLLDEKAIDEIWRTTPSH